MEEVIPTVKEYVINALAKMTDRDEIIKEVCLRENCFWEDGEALINRIERDYKIQLNKKKSPLMLVLSSVFAVAGLVWALFSFYALVAPIYVMWKQHGGLVDGIVWLYNFWLLFTFLLMGTGMAISGIFGVIHAIQGFKGEAVENPLEEVFQDTNSN